MFFNSIFILILSQEVNQIGIFYEISTWNNFILFIKINFRSNPIVVGETGEKYKNEDVIIATLTFKEFGKYVTGLNLPYKYDHALAVTV